MRAGLKRIIPIFRKESVNTSKVLFKPKFGLNETGRVYSSRKRQRPPKADSNIGKESEKAAQFISPRGPTPSYNYQTH